MTDRLAATVSSLGSFVTDGRSVSVPTLWQSTMRYQGTGLCLVWLRLYCRGR